MVTCILLSAGESRRFGSPKALAPIGKTNVIGQIQNILLTTSVSEIIVVLGFEDMLIEPHVFNHKKVRIVHNKYYKLGQTSSFQAGLLSVDKNAKGIMLVPVDCPLIKAATIERMIEEFNARQTSILIPAFEGRRGHPPIFNASLKDEILALPPMQGINALFTKYPPVNIEVNDPGVARTFNTREELEGLLKD